MLQRQFAALLGGVFISGTLLVGVAAAQQAPGPAQVGVLTLKKETVPQSFSLPGRAVAFEQVSVRPRVDGVITAILYTPGQEVKAGDPLFQLDDAAYVATVEADKATLATAEADLPVKQAAYDRAKKLVGQGYTQADFEAAQANLASAQATLNSAKAALSYAQTQLSWTTIRSPIQGIPEVQAVSVGDLVSAAQSDALTTVTRLDPIYVDMLEPSARLLEIRRRIDDGSLVPNKQIDATLMLEDGETYKGKGEIVSPSAVVSTTTGTVSVRFRFENPDHKILPGMFVRGTVTLGNTQAWLVPQRATSISTTGGLTALIVEGGKSKLVDLTYRGSYQNNWVVTGGVKDGDQVIVDGLKNLTAGRDVKAIPVTINDKGLTAEQSASGAAAQSKPAAAAE